MTYGLLDRTTARLARWAAKIGREAQVLCRLARDPRVPWHAKALALAVAGYALSPVDLIPDFMPIVGFLDDVILVPVGILLVFKLTPAEILKEHRASVAVERSSSPRP